MKETIYKFRLPLIIVGVTIIFICAAVILRLAGGAGSEEEVVEQYFDESMYPATCEEREDGSLLVTVDGSVTPELSWDITNDDDTLCEMSIVGKEKDGIVTVSMKPLESGYPSLTFTRKKEIAGVSYTVAELNIVGVASENDDGSLYMTLSEIYQDTAGFGAADTDTPYIIEGCRIHLPGGGDWALSEESGSGLFDIYMGTDDDGITYIDAYPIEGASRDQVLEETLVLKSETLGITRHLKYRTNEIGEGELLPQE